MPVEKLRGSIGRFAQDSVAFERGEPGVEKFEIALRRLGITSDEFKGKDLAERVTLVARRFNEMPEGVERGALAMDLFGKKGLEIVPLLTNIGNIAPETAARLSRLFSKKAVEDAAAMNDAMKEFGITVQGVGVNLAAGLAPAVIQQLAVLNGNVSTLAESARIAGEFIGRLFAILSLPIKGLASEIAALAAVITTGLVGAWHAATLAATGHFAAAVREAKVTAQQIGTIIKDHFKTVGDAWKAVFVPPPPIPTRTQTSSSNQTTEDSAALSTRRVELVRQQTQDSIKRIESDAKAAAANEELLFKQSLQTISEHFAERRRIIQEEVQQEIAA
ncbi:MAG TPA: hypothetical protein VN903_29195, partial [Polyangia bacterium]|nr:hypothetical protein [Polyangia bacterium]